MQDPDTVRSFYCMECGGEGDIEHEMGDGYEVKHLSLIHISEPTRPY